VGAWVLEWTRAQVALMRPDAHTGALRDIVTDLMVTDDGNTYFIKKISGVGVRYDLGDSEDLVGRRAPNLELQDGTRIADHNGDGCAVLWDFGGNSGLRTVAAGWTDRVDVITAATSSDTAICAMLVRPDGVVAWVGRSAASTDGLGAALARWFGAPIT
jgi:hypothetical protein